MRQFQSLSRDSGRLNPAHRTTSIRYGSMFQSLSRDSGRLNGGQRCFLATRTQFQSLSRDSGRLNSCQRADRTQHLVVSIPQSGFGAFELRRPVADQFHAIRFNPSVGIRGV